MQLRRTLIATSALCCLPFVAGAQQAGYNPSYLTFGAGVFEVLRSEDRSAEFRLEYRAPEFFWHVAPMLGINANSDGGAYGYAGLNLNLALGAGFTLVPNFAVGLWHEGDSRDLGGPLEFRSGIELNYQLPNKALVGLAFSHVSNAGIYDRNPGAESLVALYSMPFEW